MKDVVTRFKSWWLLCLAGPLLWFLHFSALYAVTSLGSAAGLGATGVAATVWALTAATGIILAVLWGTLQRAPSPCDQADKGAREVAGLLTLLSLAGVLLQTLPLAIS